MPAPADFRKTVLDYYRRHGRDLPWRRSRDPYEILVSEIMLQQTQASRVIPYYRSFLEKFPTVQTLAGSSTAAVLAAWQGLGYNRRALALRAAAKRIVEEHAGAVPKTVAELTNLPGVGTNTAGAILAYAYNQPVPFVETNIRKAFIRHFFPKQQVVSDREIETVLLQQVDRKNPRLWYWAVVDYGSMLGKKKIVSNGRSRHYRKQTKFEGSNRQLRSAIVKLALAHKQFSLADCCNSLAFPQSQIEDNLEKLTKEGFIRADKSGYQIVR